jgi:hypothetical protein
MVESLGIPHTEVGPVSVNGQASDLGRIVCDADRIAVEAVVPGCPVEARFVLDGHLGRLAAYLRMLGFDSSYRNNYDDDELEQSVVQETRVLLTRDRHLLMRKTIPWGYCPRSLEPQEQLVEVLKRFELADSVHLFRRCLRCNTPLLAVSKQAVLDRLQPLTRKYFDEFHLCPACDQIYWKGSHYAHMLELVQKLSTLGEIHDQSASTG